MVVLVFRCAHMLRLTSGPRPGAGDDENVAARAEPPVTPEPPTTPAPSKGGKNKPMKKPAAFANDQFCNPCYRKTAHAWTIKYRKLESRHWQFFGSNKLDFA